MSLSYDQSIFDKYRALAITEISDLEVGKTYYSNSLSNEFSVYEIRSRNETPGLADGKNLSYIEGSYWIRIESNPDSFFSYISARDLNVGASYNPWLIFKDAETRDRCVEELKIKVFRDDCNSY